MEGRFLLEIVLAYLWLVRKEVLIKLFIRNLKIKRIKLIIDFVE